VWATIALESEATMYSSLPTPTMSGEPLLATTRTPGSFSQMTAIAYAPLTSRSADCTACSRSPAYSSPMRCVSTSVSVSELKTCPFSSR